MSVSEFSEGIDTLETRKAAFEEWVRRVRIPAMQNSEGLRRIVTPCKRAAASYRIAQIPTGWAIQMDMDYLCGNYSGRGSPWTECETREACLALMGWAQAANGVQNFVLTIRPDNTASQALAAQLGFVRIGSHEDDVDGIEDILELKSHANAAQPYASVNGAPRRR